MFEISWLVDNVALVSLLMMGVLLCLAVVGRWTLNGTQPDLINAGFNFISLHHQTPQGLRYLAEKNQKKCIQCDYANAEPWWTWVFEGSLCWKYLY